MSDRGRAIAELPDWAKRLRDPVARTSALLGMGAMAAFGLLWLAWREVAATSLVGLQLPWLVSAGVVGVALIATCVALLGVHLDRLDAAVERAELDHLADRVALVADAVGGLAVRWREANPPTDGSGQGER